MDYQVIKVKEDVLAQNDKIASELRKKLRDKKIYFINVMASPGSGKTTLLINLINRFKTKYRIGVLEADIDSEVDALKVSEACNIKTIQVHTSGACHLTAQMVDDALSSFGVNDLDLVILENIGNLVCPAEFDTGSNINMMLLSVPEGHDKPLKYPLMFQVSNIAVITKIDTLPVFDFDFDKCVEYIHRRNKNAKVFKVSSIKNEGIDELEQYIDSLIKKEFDI